jgi:hypothetical protein
MFQEELTSQNPSTLYQNFQLDQAKKFPNPNPFFLYFVPLICGTLNYEINYFILGYKVLSNSVENIFLSLFPFKLV